MIEWEDANALMTPKAVHEQVNLRPNCSGAVISHNPPMAGYFLTIRLDASANVDATLEECKRDFLAILIPMLETNLAEVRRLAEEDAT